MKLISMVDFVLEESDKIYNKEDANIFASKVNTYASFLKQPLKLGMFVPCDEDGNVLEEPKKENYLTESGLYQTDCHTKAIKRYQKAKEKVLFNGFEYCLNEETNMIELECNDIFINYNIEEDLFFLDSWNDDVIIMNLECLSNSLSNTVSNIELTESAIKQIGL